MSRVLSITAFYFSCADKMVRPDITPDAPYDEQPVIGLIGMGEMGKMYAKHLSKAGWMR